MNRLDEIKEKFKDLGTLGGADVVWLFMKIKDLERHLNEVKGKYNNGDLLTTSNEFHNSIYGYIDANGFDEKLKNVFETKIEWLNFVADKYGIELEVK
ncbi:hypothetical protein ABD91_00750 [Lysinibacillus sphaericus]|uniref:hypothetical protein n=1 Tax=Lysinibacillus sphaericus TaxID=1421 RepID=UPI0018CF57CB|nr:hypothetical protein [Lysinibacillus sphaericus]MBG9689456.1 hypothetical protein [Lysinibacillus sphaericus]